MLFFSKFVIWLLSPLGMVFCLAGLALALAWRRRFRSSMALAALAFVWLWAWSMPMLSLWLCKQANMQSNQDNKKRFIYVAMFVVAYLLWTVVRGCGGADNAAVWNLLIGLAVAGAIEQEQAIFNPKIPATAH